LADQGEALGQVCSVDYLCFQGNHIRTLKKTQSRVGSIQAKDHQRHMGVDALHGGAGGKIPKKGFRLVFPGASTGSDQRGAVTCEIGGGAKAGDLRRNRGIIELKEGDDRLAESKRRGESRIQRTAGREGGTLGEGVQTGICGRDRTAREDEEGKTPAGGEKWGGEQLAVVHRRLTPLPSPVS
jgi:hypothetical protein